MVPDALILASTSRYRAELLSRLRIPFQAMAPGVDETALPQERPAALAQRLALAKASAIAQRYPGCIVIGSDQVADVQGQAMGKPGSHAKAREQLEQLSGQAVIFQTAVAVVWGARQFSATCLSPVYVRFRTLSPQDIDASLELDEPYDCAGSAKSESLGITLLESVSSDDPTSLIGLPLSSVCKLLRSAGVDPLQWALRSTHSVGRS